MPSSSDLGATKTASTKTKSNSMRATITVYDKDIFLSWLQSHDSSIDGSLEHLLVVFSRIGKCWDLGQLIRKLAHNLEYMTFGSLKYEGISIYVFVHPGI